MKLPSIPTPPKSFWMLDIETLSTKREDQSIIQVGVCLCKDGDFTTASRSVNPFKHSPDATANMDTLAWWSQQEAFAGVMDAANRSRIYDARRALWQCVHEVTGCKQTVEILQSEIDEHKRHRDLLLNSCDWYFNPPGFDAEFLEAFPSKLPLPWKWYQIKCFKTLKDSLGDFRNLASLGMDEGLKHDAGYDAELQARSLQMIFDRIRSVSQ